MIYRLKADRNRFLLFDVSPDEWLEKLGPDYFFMLDEPEWSSFWSTINGCFLNEAESSGGSLPAVPDIGVWFMQNLVLTKQAHTALMTTMPEVFSAAGEVLPVYCEGIEYSLWHISSVAGDSVIDEFASSREVEPSGHIELLSLAFKPDAEFPSPVFHTAYDGGKGLFCTQEFKDWVEAAGLNGLVFDTDLANIF